MEVGPKRLELLHELVPGAKSFGVLLNPSNPVLADVTMNELNDASQALGLQLHIVNASNETEIPGAFTKVDQLRVGAGLLIASDPFFSTRAQELVGSGSSAAYRNGGVDAFSRDAFRRRCWQLDVLQQRWN